MGCGCVCGMCVWDVCVVCVWSVWGGYCVWDVCVCVCGGGGCGVSMNRRGIILHSVKFKNVHARYVQIIIFVVTKCICT